MQDEYIMSLKSEVPKYLQTNSVCEAVLQLPILRSPKSLIIANLENDIKEKISQVGVVSFGSCNCSPLQTSQTQNVQTNGFYKSLVSPRTIIIISYKIVSSLSLQICLVVQFQQDLNLNISQLKMIRVVYRITFKQEYLSLLLKDHFSDGSILTKALR